MFLFATDAEAPSLSMALAQPSRQSPSQQTAAHVITRTYCQNRDMGGTEDSGEKVGEKKKNERGHEQQQNCALC